MFERFGCIFLPEGWTPCPTCHGSGKDGNKEDPCDVCDGIGRIPDPFFEEKRNNFFIDFHDKNGFAVIKP